MPVEKITCPECGFVVMHEHIGRKGSIEVDVLEWAQFCNRTDEAKGAPQECPPLKAAIDRLRRA